MQSTDDNRESTVANPVHESAVVAPSSEKIRTIVERETKQRKRYLRFYMALLVIPLALGIAAFIFGRSASEIKRSEVEPVVAEQLKEPLEDLGEIERRTAELKAESQEQTEKIVALDNEQGNLHEQVSSLNASPMISNPAFTKEVERMLPTIREVDRKSKRFAARLERQEEQSEGFSASQEALEKDITEIKKWPSLPTSPLLAELKSGFEKNAETINSLTKRVADMEEQRKVDRVQIASLSAAINRTGSTPPGLSYAIKESSEAELYDLGLKIKLGKQSGGKIDWIEISSAKGLMINEKKSLKLNDVEMGKPHAFQDGIYIYVLTPIYIQRRKLAKDFIGIAIQRQLQLQSP